MKTHFSRKVYVNCTSSFMVAPGHVEHVSEVMTNCRVLVREREQEIKLLLLLPVN